MSSIHGLGVNVYINHFNQKSIEKLVAAAVRLKMQWVRLEICSHIFRSKKKLKYLQMFAEHCHKKNIVVVGLLSDFIPLTFENVFSPQKKYVSVIDKIESYKVFVDSVMRVLSDTVTHWEIWNEQNTRRFWIRSPSAVEYTEFLRIVSTQIRSHQKKATIIFGGVFGNDVSTIYPFLPDTIVTKKHFIQEAVQSGAREMVQYFGFHPYTRKCYFSLASARSIAQSIIHSIEEACTYYSHLPLIITEIGVSPILNPRVRALGIAQIYNEVAEYCALRKMPVCIYALSDQSDHHYSFLNPDRDFGFLDYDLNPKQLFHEYIKLTTDEKK